MGAKTGSGRSAQQTETALFFSGNLVAQVQTAVETTPPGTGSDRRDGPGRSPR
ncbi:hypothetical protein SHIRM173S_00888 [Streptomyces hirsutus]